MEDEFGAGFVHVDTHVSSTDPFHTTESTARANRYGVSGIPHVMIDGSIAEIGADLCPLQANSYRDDINTRISQTGGTSPVEITGGMAINGNLVTVTANYKLVDAGSFTAHQATLYVYEDDITWCCGYGNVDHWDDATRMVRSTPVSLTTVGQTVTVQETWDMTTAVGVAANPANLHAVALYELVGGTKAVIQSTDFVTVEASLARVWLVELVSFRVEGGGGGVGEGVRYKPHPSAGGEGVTTIPRRGSFGSPKPRARFSQDPRSRSVPSTTSTRTRQATIPRVKVLYLWNLLSPSTIPFQISFM